MRFLRTSIIIIMGIFLLNVSVTAKSPQKESSLSFTEVVDNLDLSKKTSLYVKDYWSKIKGTEVTWTGTVQNVKGGRGKAQVLVANKKRRTYKGYNIVLTTYDIDSAAGIEMGQKIKFTGYLNKYKGRKGNPIIIYLTEVEFNSTK